MVPDFKIERAVNVISMFIRGEEVEKELEKTGIEILAINHDILPAVPSGRGRDKRILGPIEVIKKVDSFSPLLISALI
ncbi:MAG TPA: type VI secretion system tube protein Hcp [Candidatus Methanoperedenaceae archaeon]|nr:type VI secretion system tube protein Hcp [Candidatus Methanoperedenaceae archaeon]